MLTVTREGSFWEAVEGRAPLSPSAVTLGWELVAIDPEEGTIEVACTAGGAFLNPAGVVQGGFLAATHDETMGPALACGPEPMLEAIRALASSAQLAWEAPMACGYGACYGCAVEIDGELKRLCIDGPVLVSCAA